VHLAHRAGLEALVDVVRDLGDEQLVAVLDSMRATSRPTLPAPTTAIDSASSGQSRGTSGVAVEPGDELRAAEAARQVDAGTSRSRSFSAPVVNTTAS
jgi:hypothetical protein